MELKTVMLSTNKLFLLLILLAAACTGGNRRLPPTPLDQNQKTEHSGKISELQKDLDKILNNVTVLESQVELKDLRQGQLDILQRELTAVEEKITQTDEDGNVSNDLVQQLQKTVVKLRQRLAKLQEKLDARDSIDEDEEETTPDIEAGDAPVLHVSLVELEQDTQDREAGTYVTFYSKKHVTINNIKYNAINLEVYESLPTKIKSMKLPVSVGFTHADTSYCVRAAR